MTNNLLTIAIIGGTGKEGTGLAMRWAAAGYKVVIGSREISKARQTANMINQKLGVDTIIGLVNMDAVKMADICILTVVQSAHQQAIENLKGSLTGKILVDTTARVDYRDPLPPEPPSAGQQAQGILGSTVRVVAAFQNIPAQSLTRSIGQLMDADVLVCSDDIEAAEQVIRLAKAAGMRGYYAGGLAYAIVVEGLTSVLISMNKHYGIKNASIRISGILEKQ
jgi:8-hydroxy-5-deazaflavin:NADPH oxidoreductase